MTKSKKSCSWRDDRIIYDSGTTDQRPEQSEQRGLQLENASRRCLADYSLVMSLPASAAD